MESAVTTIRPLRADTGLCEYEDPDTWFRGYSGERESAAICTNCPIIVACAQNALRFGATDGVWASVAMPGARDVTALKAARAQLREVIARYRNQPPALRLGPCKSVRPCTSRPSSATCAADKQLNPRPGQVRR